MFNDHNTNNIRVSADYKTLECGRSVTTTNIDSISHFYKTSFLSSSLEEQICTMDAVFDGSLQDRIHLLGFSDAKLDFAFINRPDIAQYFYRKAVSAAPEDSLSQYVLSEKITN